MKITISGMPGSGKSTLARALAEKLKLKHYSMGKFHRDMARQRNMSELEFNELAAKDLDIHKEIDQQQIRLKNEDNFVLDSRLGFHFIPDSIKIFLKINIETGAERIMQHPRKGELYKSEEEAVKAIKKRIDLEKQTYKTLYQVDHYNLERYDFVLDTTHLAVEKATQKTLDFLKSFK